VLTASLSAQLQHIRILRPFRVFPEELKRKRKEIEELKARLEELKKIVQFGETSFISVK